MNVFIMVRCTDIMCKAGALLVFDTIRVGYPTWKITCVYLGDYPDIQIEIEAKCKENNIAFTSNWPCDTNDEVIELLVNSEQESFVVADSDMIFHKSLEWYQPRQALAGRFQPRYFESTNQTTTEERLHTSLLYFEMPTVREDIARSYEQQPKPINTPYDVFSPFVYKYRGKTLFYDSCCSLYHAIGGEMFGKDVLECYDHLHGGSYFNIVSGNVTRDIWAELKIGKEIKGLHKLHNEYWYKHAYLETHEKIKNAIGEDAQRFLISYGRYVNMVDDVVDEEKSHDMIQQQVEMATRLFSSNYWLANAQYLRVVEQLVHVIYFTILGWESSNEAWKRRDARAINHCADFMIIAVMLLETNNPKFCIEIAKELMEKFHLAQLEDLTQEEMYA